MIKCSVNGKRYIGSSVDIGKRVNQHFGKTCVSKYANKNAFYKDIELYGRDSFEVSVLEFCSCTEKFDKERWWYMMLQPEYNTVIPDECPFVHEEVRRKAELGCKSEKGRAHIKQAHDSDNYRQRCRESKLSKMKPCFAISEDGTRYEFDSRVQAAKWLNRNSSLPSVVSHVSNAVKNKSFAFGYRWEVVE